METITIPVPEHLQTGEIPFFRFENIPIDIRSQMSGMFGLFDIADGRIYVPETDADYDVTLQTTKELVEVKGVRAKIKQPLNVIITPCSEPVVRERANARRLKRDARINAALRRSGA